MSSYIPIASQTLTGSVTSVTFSSIPTTLNGKTLRDLVLVFQGKGSAGLVLRINGDTGANYNDVNMQGNGSTRQSLSQSGATLFYAANSSLDNPLDGTTQANATFQLFDFAQTDKHKSILCRVNRSNGLVVATAGRWASTSAITSLEVRTNFISGDTFSLYGIEG